MGLSYINRSGCCLLRGPGATWWSWQEQGAGPLGGDERAPSRCLHGLLRGSPVGAGGRGEEGESRCWRGRKGVGLGPDLPDASRVNIHPHIWNPKTRVLLPHAFHRAPTNCPKHPPMPCTLEHARPSTIVEISHNNSQQQQQQQQLGIPVALAQALGLRPCPCSLSLVKSLQVALMGRNENHL